MDAITLLKADHKTVEQLFKQFEKAGDRAFVRKRQIADRIVEALAAHAVIEEQLFYPVTRATVPAVEDIALESLEEHHIVKWVLSEIADLDPEDERFDAKVTVLIENVRHHVDEEESDYFPKVRDALSRKQLAELGDAMEVAKETAPTRPHPRSPDTPPANILVGAVASVADKVADTVSGLTQGGISAADDLIARFRGARPSASAPTGSAATRSTARRVRSKVAEAADDAESTAKRSTRHGKTTAQRTTRVAHRTTSAARSGAKATATSARKGARRTATTAKGAATRTTRAATSASH